MRPIGRRESAKTALAILLSSKSTEELRVLLAPRSGATSDEREAARRVLRVRGVTP